MLKGRSLTEGLLIPPRPSPQSPPPGCARPSVVEEKGDAERDCEHPGPIMANVGW